MGYSLPAPLQPLPGESLGSLIVRTGYDYGLANPMALFSRVDLGRRRIDVRDASRFSPQSEEAKLLRQVLDLSEEAFIRMSAHSISADSARIMGKEVDRVHLAAFRRFCPACLEEGVPYHRVAWDLLPLTACPRHALLLQDRCPVCGKTTIWATGRLEYCSAWSCASDLRHAAGIAVPKSSMEGVREIWTQLNQSDDLPFPIQGLSFRDWLVLSNVLGAIELGIDPSRRIRRTLDPFSIHSLLDAGFTILRGWPTTFHAALDRWRVRTSLPATRKKRFRVLGQLQTWMDANHAASTVPPLRAALSQYLFDRPEVQFRRGRFSRYLRTADAKSSSMSQTDAVAALGVSIERFELLARTYDLYYSPKTSMGDPAPVRADTVEMLKLKAAQQLTLREAPRLVGIPYHSFRPIREQKLIPEIPLPERIRAYAVYDRRAIVEFLATLEAKIVHGPIRDLVGLSFARQGVRTALHCCQAILEDRLAPRGIDSTATGLRRLLFDRDELQVAIRRSDTLLTPREIALMLGVCKAKVFLLLRSGLLQPAEASSERRRRLGCRQDEVQRFRAAYVCGEELRRLTGVAAANVCPQILKRAGILPVESSSALALELNVFRRAELEGIDPRTLQQKSELAKRRGRRRR